MFWSGLGYIGVILGWGRDKKVVCLGGFGQSRCGFGPETFDVEFSPGGFGFQILRIWGRDL